MYYMYLYMYMYIVQIFFLFDEIEISFRHGIQNKAIIKYMYVCTLSIFHYIDIDISSHQHRNISNF